MNTTTTPPNTPSLLRRRDVIALVEALGYSNAKGTVDYLIKTGTLPASAKALHSRRGWYRRNDVLRVFGVHS
jgi:hypothetical protein